MTRNIETEKNNDSFNDKKMTYYPEIISPNSGYFNSGLLLSPERTYNNDERIKVLDDFQAD